MRPLKQARNKRYSQKENAFTEDHPHFQNTIAGWDHQSANILCDNTQKLNLQTKTKIKTIRNKKCKTLGHKENKCDTEISDIDNLKQIVLKLENDKVENISLSKFTKKIENKKIQNKRERNLQSLFRLTTQGIITQSINNRHQKSFRKRSLIKIDPRSPDTIKKVRDNLMRDWDNTRKCISSTASGKSSQRTYLNYSERIRNFSVIKKNRIMRLNLEDYSNPRISFNTTIASNICKMDLVDAILKGKFPQIF